MRTYGRMKEARERAQARFGCDENIFIVNIVKKTENNSTMVVFFLVFSLNFCLFECVCLPIAFVYVVYLEGSLLLLLFFPSIL